MASILLERPRRAVSPAPRRATFHYIERYRLAWTDAGRVLIATWIRRRAFRVIRWTQRIEARALARSIEVGN